MKDESKTKEQLINELVELRQRVAELKASETDRKRVEEALRESEEQYRNVVERANDGIAIIQDAIIKYVNPRLVEMWGGTAEEVTGAPFTDYVDPHEHPQLIARYKRRMAGEDVPPIYAIIFRRKDGSKVCAEINAGLITYQGKPADLVIVRDITERKRIEEALRESEEKFKAQYKGIPVPTYTWQRVGEDFVLVGYNDAAEAITRGNVVNFVGRTASGMYRDRPDIVEELRRCFTEKITIKREMEYRFMITGESKYLAVTYGFVPPDLVMVHTEDITERKRAEEEISHRTKQLALISEVRQRIAPILELSELYQTVVEAVQEKFGYQYVSIFLVRDDEVALEAIAGPHLELIPSGYKQKVGEGMVGWVAQTGERLLANDVTKEPQFLPLEFLEIAAELDVPIRLGGKTIGVLAVASDQPNIFLETDATTLETIADQVARAIENARLYAEEQKRRQEAETLHQATQALSTTLDLQEVFQLILSELQQVVPYDSASVQLLKGDRLEIIGGYGFPNLNELLGISFPVDGDNPNRQVIATRTPFLVEDAPAIYANFRKEPHAQAGIRGWLGVPLLFGDRLIGMIALDKKVPGFYTQEHAHLALAFAAQAAIAIENARLYEEAQRRIGELSGLHEISQAFSSMAEARETFGELTKRMAQFIGCQICVIATYDDQAREMQAQPPGYGAPDELVCSFRYNVDVPGARDTWNFRLQGPLLANDIAQIPDFFSQWVEGFGLFNLLIVPMTIEGRVTGLVYAANKPDGFAKDDSKLLTIFASQAAVIIENAHLYEEERRRSLQRKTIAEVGRVIASILDLDTLLSRVVDLIAQNFGYYFVHIFEVYADTGYAVFKSGTGEVGRRLKEEGVRLKVGEEGITGWVAQSGQPLMANDVHKEPRYYFHPALPDTRSELAVPIRLGEKTIGVLDVQSEELGAFDESDLATLETLAGQLAVAMENARLYEEERKRSEELSVLLDTAQTLASSLDLGQVLEIIASQAKELTKADGSRIYLLEPDEETLKALVVLEHYAEEIMATPVVIGQGITGYVAATGIPEIVNHAERDPRAVQVPGTPEEAQCLMCAPLLVKGNVIGVMTLSREGEKEFQEGDLRLLTSLASQAATAIENARLYEETKRLAATDPLTGVWNRRHIGERLRTEVARARRFGHELSVLVMDIDNLKLFNDTYGHAAGDKVIRTVAQVVLASCREIDIVGRYGGDEFAVILPEADARGTAMVAERILVALAKEPFQAPNGTKVPINISIGAASYPSDSDEADRLFSLADAAMYRAKVAGGGQFASLVAGPQEVPEELVVAFDVLHGLLITVDAKDRYTFKHSQEVTERALALARAVGLSEEDIKALEIAGRLHDVGKIGIPTNVLRKPGPLTPEEWKMIQQHPRLGHMLLQQIPQMETVLQAVLHHHERYDSKGYPLGLQGENIPLLSRILAVADAFSAMMTDRPYRKAFTREEALAELRSNAGKQFDPVLAEKFIELVEKGEIG